jgi:hypothetical protein
MKMSEEWHTPKEKEEVVEEGEDIIEIMDDAEEFGEKFTEEEETKDVLEVLESSEEELPEEEEPYLVMPKIPGFEEEEEVFEEELENAELGEVASIDGIELRIPAESNDEVEIKKKTRKKIKDLPPKKRTTVMGLIFLFASLVASIVFSVAYHFTPLINKSKNGVLDVLPGNFIVEIAILWAAIFATFFVFLALLPYFSKFFIFLHKIVKRFKFKYSVVETDEHYYNFKEIFKRVLPVFSISFLLGYWFGKWFFVNNIGVPGDEATNTMVYILVAFIMMPLATLITSPLWLLNDSGIIAMRIRKEGDSKIPDIEGPTVFFFDFFTGSVTPLAITTLVIFITDLVKDFQWDIVVGFIFVMIIVFPLIILAIIYLYEVFMRKLKSKLHRILPNKLVDKMPKTVVDISAFDPFYVPKISEEKVVEIDPDELKDPREFQIDTDELSYD